MYFRWLVRDIMYSSEESHTIPTYNTCIQFFFVTRNEYDMKIINFIKESSIPYPTKIGF